MFTIATLTYYFNMVFVSKTRYADISRFSTHFSHTQAHAAHIVLRLFLFLLLPSVFSFIIILNTQHPLWFAYSALVVYCIFYRNHIYYLVLFSKIRLYFPLTSPF